MAAADQISKESLLGWVVYRLVGMFWRDDVALIVVLCFPSI